MIDKLNRKLFWAILLLILGAALFFYGCFSNKSEPNPPSPAPTESETIEIILAGDIMLDRGVEYMIAKEGEGDFRFPFLNIAEEFQRADIVFGNLEGPISDKGVKVGSIYSFRMDPKALDGLQFAGFNLLSLANNHALDYTREALKDTLLRLKEVGIDYVGAGMNATEAYSPIIKEIKGAKIGFLSYTNLGPEIWQATGSDSGMAWISEPNFEKIKKDIKSAKEKSDILIVSLHAGEEYQKTPNQFQIDFAKMAVDAGADLFVGHHPHVVQPNERYVQGHIFYSLGNFIFDQGFSEETTEGQIVRVTIEDNKVKEASPIGIKMNSFFQPAIVDK